MTGLLGVAVLFIAISWNKNTKYNYESDSWRDDQ